MESHAAREREIWLKGSVLWANWNTPLEQYTPGLGNPLGFLECRIRKAIKEDRKLRVMDIGMGEGRQWTEFYEKYKNYLDFWATTPIQDYVLDVFRPMTRCCRASLLMFCFNEPHFQESFDVILSSKGMHKDEPATLVSIAKLLKVNGEALLHTEMGPGQQDEFRRVLQLTGLKEMPGSTNDTYFIMKTRPFDDSYYKIMDSLDMTKELFFEPG